MRERIEKFISIEKEIAEERGEFSLFALFLREDSPDRWDLVVAADWFGGDQKRTLDYFAKKLKSRLRLVELIKISRIILLQPNEASVKSILQAFEVEHGCVEVRDSVFFGLHIKRGYIITSKREAPVPVTAD